MAKNEKEIFSSQEQELLAITPLDGRYKSRTEELNQYVSEYALIKTRFEIEGKYLVALSKAGVVRTLTDDEEETLLTIGETTTLQDAERVKEIEKQTRHDVKAMERTFRERVAGSSLEDVTEWIHFGLTSEDVNNLSYRLMLQRATQEVIIPTVDTIVDELVTISDTYKTVPMLARTHGQPAVPTTVGHEFAVFASRVNSQNRKLENTKLTGKLNGAVGNYNALHFTHPDVDWIEFSDSFIKSLGLEPNHITTQINPYDDVVEYLQTYQRLNGILIGFDQDIWRYISDKWIVQQAKSGEVGSSTMPQKVNPIDFENSESNLDTGRALAEGLSRKLEMSRLQRDLSDSSSIRNIGSVLGYSLVGYKSIINGMGRIKPNVEQINNDLHEDWTILSEGVQQLLRSRGFSDPYSLVSSLTRGEHINETAWKEWVNELPIDDTDLKDKIKNLTPEKYIGLAVELTDKAITDIHASRKK